MAGSIGTTVVDQRESTLLQTVVDAILLILDELGPLQQDEVYLEHPRWPDVRHTSRMAFKAMRRADSSVELRTRWRATQNS